VRGLLGTFSLDSLDQISAALAASDSRRMLEVVDELERNGHNLQHFSRELSRYFRNLLVARIAGAATRLIAASAAQRERLAGVAAQFSEEDLTRYLHLSLELFRDLQFSLQPRFHLEIGLVRLVQAGRLMPIEQALANLPAAGAPPAAPAAPRVTQTAPAPAARAVVSPFERDRARKAAQQQPPEPQSSGANALAPQPAPRVEGISDWRQRLHAALVELGMTFTADAVENSSVKEANGELQFVTSAAYRLALQPDDLLKALKHLSAKPMRIKVTVGEAENLKPMEARADEASARALANPEVRRFREVFGGEVRKVRNLKE
jgi:DNA polymerase III subunit gamma/tau